MLRSMVSLYLCVALTAALSIFCIERGTNYLVSNQFRSTFEVQFAADAMIIRNYFGADSRHQEEAANKLEHASNTQYVIWQPGEAPQLGAKVQQALNDKGFIFQHDADDLGFERYIRLDNGAILAVHTEDNFFFWFRLAALVILFLVLLGGVMLWGVPHMRELRRLAQAASQFGGGVLSVRVPQSRYTTIGPLVSHFNGMAEQIEQLVRSQRDMVNAVSHELRTPLARMQFGLANLRDLVEDMGADKAVSRIDGLHGDVDELEALVAELLSLATLEQVDGKASAVTLDAASFLREAHGLSAEELKHRGVGMIWDLAVPVTIATTQPEALRRAFSNLLRNAMRYASTSITVRTEAGSPGHGRFVVEDDGPGIPPAERLRVFEAFYRLDRSRDRTTGGFGLGLAIVHKIVSRHKGRIWVENSPAGGARFVIELPE